ncbi:MAG: DUF72 domain-containing protein [Candidatus Margulisiibacteriota bacterium]
MLSYLAVGSNLIKVGTCGWGFLRPKDYFGENWKDKFASTLQAYAKLFDEVEINSTFYRIPRLTTSLKWRKEVDEVNRNFEFTVKISKIITHLHKFLGEECTKIYKIYEEICHNLKAEVLLFQTAAGFKPTSENIKNMKSFFKKIKPKIKLVWEPRGAWYKDQSLIADLCEEFNIIHGVDPLRNEPLYFSKDKIAYFRLHGFGKPSIYNYVFNEQELKRLKKIIEGLKRKVKTFYVFFNNMAMYEDALRFCKLIS